jgi:hypothetical protein
MADAFRGEVGVTVTASQLVLKKPDIVSALGNMVADIAEGLKGKTALSFSTVLWNSNAECNGRFIIVNTATNGFIGGLFGGGSLGSGSGGLSGNLTYSGIGGGGIQQVCGNETWQMSRDGGNTWENFTVPTCRFIFVS